MKEDEIVGNIYKTKDYKKFKKVLANRDMDQGNLKRIICSISKKQYNKPILVTRNQHYILDGNHTFIACEQLSKWIYYAFLDDIETEEEIVQCIKDLNASGKTWTIKDYIKYYTVLKNENYIQLSRMMKEFPKINSTETYINIAQDSFRRGRTGSDVEGPAGYIKEGKFIFKDYDRATKTCEMMNDFACLEIFKVATFKNSLLRAFRCNGYKHEEFLRKIKANKEMLRNYNNCIDYLQLFSAIYNKNRKKEFIQFDIEYYKSIENKRKCS